VFYTVAMGTGGQIAGQNIVNCSALATCGEQSSIQVFQQNGRDSTVSVTFGHGAPQVASCPTSPCLSYPFISLATSPQAGEVNHAITLTAAVGTYSGVGTSPAGTVEFDEYTQGVYLTLCSGVAVSQGSPATCTWTPTTSGSPVVFATFTPSAGQENPGLQTARSVLVGTLMPTGTSLNASASSVLATQPIQYTATVGDAYSGGPAPSGTVTFTSGSTTLCSAVPRSSSSGGLTATCSTSFPVAGSDPVTATYSGDTATDPSAATVTTAVTPEPIVMDIQVPPLLIAGPSDPITVQISAGGVLNSAFDGYQAALTVDGSPLCTVTFSDPDATPVLGASDTGTCTVGTGGVPALPAGSHTIAATFLNSTAHVPPAVLDGLSGQASLPVTVYPSTVTVTVSGSDLAPANGVTNTPGFYYSLSGPPRLPLTGQVTCVENTAGNALNNIAAGTYTVKGSTCSGLSITDPTLASELTLTYTGAANGYVVTPNLANDYIVTVTGTQTYGGSPSFSYTTNQLPAGTTSSGLSGTVTCTTVDGGIAITPAQGIGQHRLDGVHCSGLSASPTAPIEYIGGTFNVAPEPITVNVTGSQGYQSNTPGFLWTNTPNITLAGKVTCTTVNGGAPITPLLDVDTFYTLDGSSCTGLNDVEGTYQVTYVGGAYSISPIPVTVTPTGSQTYGGTPTFSYTTWPPTPLLGALTCTTVGQTTITPTLYPAVFGQLGGCTGLYSLHDDHRIIWDSGDARFTVNQDPVTVGVTGGETVGGYPVFTYTTAQASPGLTGSVQCTTVNGGTPISGLPVGTYTIDSSSCSGLTGANNGYAVIYQGGTYTVSPVATFIPSALPPAVSGMPYSATAQITGGTAPYSFTASFNPLGTITGLTLTTNQTAGTVTVSGTPQGVSAVGITVLGSDASGEPIGAGQTFTIDVVTPITQPGPATTYGDGQSLSDSLTLDEGQLPGDPPGANIGFPSGSVTFTLTDPDNRVVETDTENLHATGSLPSYVVSTSQRYVPILAGTYTWQVTFTETGGSISTSGGTETVAAISSISNVSIFGTSKSPEIAVSGTGFGSSPPTRSYPADRCSGTGSLYGNSLFFQDLTANWNAGQGISATGDCVGLIVASWSNTHIVLRFGNSYGSSGWVLDPGDSYAVVALGAMTTGTTEYNPLTVSPASGTPGALVEISGNFLANQIVKVSYSTGLSAPYPTSVALCSGPAGSNGSFSCSAKIPSTVSAGAQGAHVLVAKQAASGLKATVGFTTTANVVGPADTLVADAGHGRVVDVPADGAAPFTVGSGFSDPFGVAVDASGDVFVSDFVNNDVTEVPANFGPQKTIGSGLNSPEELAVDAKGDLYIADYGNSRVVKVTPAGVQTTVGTGLNSPTGVAVDASGNVYIADFGNGRVVKVAPDGKQTTLGSGFTYPDDVAVDTAGDVYVTDQGNSQVVKIAPNGTQTSIGSGLNSPFAVAVDPSGNVLVADYSNNRIEKIAPEGTQTTVGTGFSGPAGVASSAPPPKLTADKPATTATVGTAYSYTYEATVQVSEPIATFRIASGSVPPGLTLDPTTGVLSGTPTTAGTYHFTIEAVNAATGTLSPKATITVS
jgi:hypothetical protein